jgi:hypothetical protein
MQAVSPKCMLRLLTASSRCDPGHLRHRRGADLRAWQLPAYDRHMLAVVGNVVVAVVTVALFAATIFGRRI